MKQKVSRVAYSKAMLPRTRREQFLDCYKMNFILLLKCGLTLLLFALPLILFCIFMDFYYMSILNHVTEAVEQTKLVFFFLYNLGVIILCSLLIFALSGITHILRNFIWQEGIYFREDFGKGIKQNIGKNMVFYGICALLYLLSIVVYSLFNVSLISYVPLVIFVLIIFPIFIWFIFLNNTYTSKFFPLVRNSTFFYIKSLGWSLLATVVLFSSFAVIFIPLAFVWLKYIVVTLYFIFIYPAIFLVMVLYTTHKFDEFINKENYPEYYLKGLNHD